MDFTIRTYKKLLQSIVDSDYPVITKSEYFSNSGKFNKFIILRHDVDERPINALNMARVEHSLGLKSTYYFRIVKISNNADVIRQIVSLGHEIGYHYEDLALSNGNIELALNSFDKNLKYFRENSY